MNIDMVIIWKASPIFHVIEIVHVHFNGYPYIFLIYYNLLYMFVYHIFMTSPLWLAVGPQSL